MATLGAYRLLVCNVEHDVSPGRGLFVQSKRALCPKSGQEAYRLMATLGAYRLLVCNVEHDVSPGRGLFVQSKRALCPKSGQEATYQSNDNSLARYPFCMPIRNLCR